MLTAANETSPCKSRLHRDTRVFFHFYGHPSIVAKRKNPAIQAPHFWLKRHPAQKPLQGDFGDGVYHIKKKLFDEEGTQNGGAGIGLFYFPARYYDPEIGIVFLLWWKSNKFR